MPQLYFLKYGLSCDTHLLLLFCRRYIWHSKITLIITTFRHHSRKKRLHLLRGEILISLEQLRAIHLLGKSHVSGYINGILFLACCLAKVKFFLQVFLLGITELSELFGYL